jgi:hypothetical protein
MPDGDPQTEELIERAKKRERDESDGSKRESDPVEAQTHARRSQKAAYLREKLEERARSERETSD